MVLILYILYKIKDLIDIKLYSIPCTYGEQKAITMSRVFHSITFFIPSLVGIIYNFQIYYWIGTFAVTSLLIYQHYLITPVNLKKINIVFFTTNGIASLIFAIFIIIDLITQSSIKIFYLDLKIFF